MRTTRLVSAFYLAGMAAATLTACGGSSSSSDPVSATPSTVDLSTRVIDGPIEKAKVCLDRNDNGACDDGEPFAITGADGSATLKIASDEVGKFPLLTLVGTDATDRDAGAVPVAFAMRTSADSPALVSPLTTLVTAFMDVSGLSSTAAAETLQQVIGANVPLLSDYTQGSDEASRSAAVLARFLTVATQASVAALASAEGQMDSGLQPIARADLDRVIAARMIDLLPAAVSVGATNPDAQEAAIKAAAQALISAELALNLANIGTVVGHAKQIEKPSAAISTAPIAASVSLDWLRYADARNWYFRVFEATAQQNTPDAAGKVYYNDKRKRSLDGVVARWGEPGYTNTIAYNDGTRWFLCPTDFAHPGTPRDAQGRSESRYCGASHSTSRRSARDIGGQKMSDVVTEIRAYPLPSTQGVYPQWGPDPASGVLGATTFPMGSKLYFQTSTLLSAPDAYDTSAAKMVRAYTPAVAAGTRAECDKVTSANAGTFQSAPQTLEALIERTPGKPCVYAPNEVAGARDEWWSNSTLSLGDVAGPVPTLPHYQAGQPNRTLRVAFTGGNGVTYYNCARRASDGSVRNCNAIGTGSYSIETVADARVMRFANLPATASTLTYHRLYVERGGSVYFGFRSKPGVNHAVRLNAESTDALLGQLGLTR